MTDRELLELAAKAAGYEYGIIHQRPHVRCDAGWTPWNPIDDDGAALRLAARLRLVVSVHCATAMAQYYIPNEERMATFKERIHSIDHPFEATRRAIVRAAAEIGRSMSHN